MHRFVPLFVLMPFALPNTGWTSDIELADGLNIRQVADDDLVPDCTNITVDPRGNVIASGPGYLRMLVDEDDDGRFDRFVTLADGPSHGAHGLYCDGAMMLYVGDNGVWKLTDLDGDGIVDSPAVRMLEIKTGGEHDAHAIRKGPDDHWYLICGNGTKGMFDLQNIDAPSIDHPRAGAIWRISPDWSQREVWAHGFRNAYDFDFAPGHAIDTFDSDGERDVSLPWYRPTRVFRVRQGDDAGWMTRSWKRPNDDPQMPKVLAEFGRGSPTGVMRYRHRRLPARFHHGVFVLDWTFGRILFVDDDGRNLQVARPRGTAGFAVTDIDALPDGRLVIAVGGRRSRGGLYIIDADDPSSESAKPQVLWPPVPPAIERSKAIDWIARLRDRSERMIDHNAASHATRMLQNDRMNESETIIATTLLIESVGGLGAGDPKDARGKEQVAAVFDSCRSLLRPKLRAETREAATAALIRIIRSDRDHAQRNEAIRALAVIQPDSKKAFATIVADIDRVESPTDKLHHLIALARLPVARDDEMTEQVVDIMLEIPVTVDELSWSIDRNWTPRLGELHAALQRRDSLLTSRLVANPRFGHRAHLVWSERMDPENLERARQRFLSLSARQEIDPAVARFIALGNDAVTRPHIRKWLKDPLTRPAAWLAIANHPQQSDVDVLTQAAQSVDKTVREAAIKALERLGVEVPERTPDSDSIRRWLEKADLIAELKSDAKRGRELFVLQNCAKCHSGAKALGPRLEGIAKRFNRQDLLRATVDPSHHIPDRYRAKQVLTTDDQILVGMTIYESVDGLTLLTADAKTLRVNSDSIVEVKTAEKSLMPDGLIDGLSDQQVADLLAYMRSL